MTLGLSSFRMRLVLGAVLWISLGFLVSWVVLTNLLRVHVLHEFASELDHHATELAELAVLDPSGTLAIRAPLSDFRFGTAPSGRAITGRSRRPTARPLFPRLWELRACRCNWSLAAMWTCIRQKSLARLVRPFCWNG